jgi:hypothetical protein
VSPVKYELGFYIPEDGILYSHRREDLKSYIVIALISCFRMETNADRLHTGRRSQRTVRTCNSSAYSQYPVCPVHVRQIAGIPLRKRANAISLGTQTYPPKPSVGGNES